MGTSCSSLKKEHKKSIDSSTSIEEKRCTNRSTENPQNLTKKSGPVPCEPSNVTTSLPPSIEKHENSTTKKPLPSSSELRPPSQTTNINYENHLTAPSVTPSPLPSSHTPSPYTTPSANKQLSLTPSGLPNLGIFTNDVRNILIGQRHQFSSPISRIPSNRELNIYLITTDMGRYEILVSKVTEALKLSLPTQKFNISCSSFNLEPFYMYDRSHRYKEICLDSMKYLSDRGYLVPIIILNGKDDHKLLPRTIEEKAFQMIFSSCEGQTKQFFQKWYQKDDNQLSSTYVLHKLDEHLKISKEISLSERKEIFKKWSQESAEAIKFITEESQNQDINNLVSSILEIQLEFFSNDRFTGNKKTLLVKLGKLDSLSVKARNAINKIDEKVGSARKLSLSNSDPSALISNDFEGELHNFLLESLRKIMESINEDEFSIEYHKQFSGIEQSLCNELIVQSCHRHKLDQTFIGRESLLSSVQLYLTSEAKKPLIIHGPKGSGKSSLLAKISTLTSTWLPSSVVVYRFAGISEQSLTCEQLLRSVCEQLCILFGENPCTAASIAVDLNNTLKKLLCKPNEERSLVIIIDGIDRFEEYKWLDVHSWLNSELSKFVKIIISFTWLIDSRELSLTDMMKELSLEGSELIDCSNISYEDVETIFNGVLTRNDCRITTAQHTCVSNLLKKHLSPRYAHLLSLEVSKIGDAVSLEQLEYLQSEENIISQQITKIAEMIESPLLVAIITLLMSTKNGLTDFEITTILLRLQPLQDMVYTDASNNFPFSMWFLIYCRMTCLIDQIYAFGTQCLRISSSQVRESANLFCKKWKDVIKLTQQELLNYVSVSKDELDSSKIHLECDAFSNQWPNRRKALEFPHLLIKSDDGVSLFCQHYCFNISWLCFKLYYSDPFHLIEDIELLKLVSKANEETTTSKSDAQKCLMDAQILSDTIKHSAHPLRYHGLQVISQLYSRLSTYFKDPNSSLNKTYPRISDLLKECQQPIVPSLMPLNTQLMAINKKIFEIDAKNFEIKDPSGETDTELHQYDSIHTIKGDHAHVIALSTSRGEISVWNVIREKPIRSLRGINQPKDIRMINKFQAVVLCNRDLKIYDLNEGTMVNKLKGVMNQKMPFFGLHDENYLVALSRNRMYVNLQSLKTGDLETTFKVGEDRFLNSLLVSANGKFCVCGDETQKPFPLLVWDLSNRKLIYDLRIPHHEFITRLSAISDDGHYVVCVSKELNSTSPNFIIVYDLQSGTLFKKWKPDCDTVSITISSQGSCVINGLESTLISVWDLSTGAKRLTLKGHRSPVDTLQIDDRGKTLLSFDSTGRDTSIRLWNLDNGLCLAVFTPDIPLSCCRLMGSGKMVLICFIDSSKLHTLVLRSRDDAHENEMKNLSSIVYGELDNEGKQFDLNNS